MSHTHTMHTTTRTEGGTTFDTCVCGATKVTERDGKVRMGYFNNARFDSNTDSQGWHTCTLCTHAFGRTA